jgi:phage terminase small subunit
MMGYRGPTPKPSSIARAEGNPGKRRLNDSEPQPRNVAPKCPEYLDERARKEWKRLVPVLRRMKVLTEADGMALANLCQTYSTMIKAQEKLSELGILYTSCKVRCWGS